MALQERIDKALADSVLRAAVAYSVDAHSIASARVVPPEIRQAWRAEARQVRMHAVRHLPELIEQFADRATEHGVQVHFAGDGAEARDIILGLAQQHGVRSVVKSKSMASEEIELTQALEQAGMSVVETDLGEYIVQLAHEPPSHIVGPAIHKTRQQIAELFSAVAGEPIAEDTVSLARFAQRHLRRQFQEADLGISGGNFLVAETGTVVVVSNEGNARMVSTVAPHHIALVGVDKVIATWEDLGKVLRMLALASTGQKITVYVSLITRPKHPGDLDGPEDVHVVLLDNGRSGILGTPYEETLMCIRCGACLDICPVYRQIGGHAYGSVYSGPIGAVITPLLKGVSAQPELPFASTLCGACWEVCPVGIHLHEHLLHLRADVTRSGLGFQRERLAFRAMRYALGTPGRFRFSVGALAFARRSMPSFLPEPVKIWARGRVVPDIESVPFREQWRRRGR